MSNMVYVFWRFTSLKDKFMIALGTIYTFLFAVFGIDDFVPKARYFAYFLLILGILYMLVCIVTACRDAKSRYNVMKLNGKIESRAKPIVTPR
jgi:arginine exporter protein ArgO